MIFLLSYVEMEDLNLIKSVSPSLSKCVCEVPLFITDKVVDSSQDTIITAWSFLTNKFSLYVRVLVKRDWPVATVLVLD